MSRHQPDRPGLREAMAACREGDTLVVTKLTANRAGAPLTGHTGAVIGVAFSPNGQRLASASKDATLRVWPALASPDMLCAKLTANMSYQQWRTGSRPISNTRRPAPDLPTPS